MNTVIRMQPQDIFGEFILAKSDMDAWDEIKIGDNFDLGTSLSLGITPPPERRPIFFVYLDGEIIDDKEIIGTCNADMMSDTAHYLIEQYLEGEAFLHQSFQDQIDDREEELTRAVEDFLDVALYDANAEEYVQTVGSSEINKIVSDCKEAFLCYLVKKHGMDLYRPSVTEAGKCVMYPYRD